MDQFDIPTGARWDDEIERALKDCQIFLFIITPASIASANAKDEMGYAIDHGKYILPVLLEKCEVPLRLRRMQYVDFTQLSFEDGVQRVKELLSRLIGEIEGRPAGVATIGSGVSALTETKTVPTGTVSYPPRWKGPGRRSNTRYAVGGVILFMGVLLSITLLLKSNLPGFLPSSFLSPTHPAFTTASPEALLSTSIPAPSEMPVTPTLEKSRSFVEDFKEDTRWNSEWTLLFRHANQRKTESFHHDLKDGNLAFLLDYEYIWAYFLYNQILDYSNIELEAVVSDMHSTDTFGLICHYGKDGWYEFDINGGGHYFVRYVDAMSSGKDDPRYLIGEGSIPNFHFSEPASSENTIQARCNGNLLSLAVNGRDLVMDYQVGSYYHVLNQGQAGIVVRSDQHYPTGFALKSISITEK